MSYTERDADGWLLPKRRDLYPPSAQPADEVANQIRLVTVLVSARWTVQQHIACYTRDGDIRIPDLLVRHPEMDNLVGAIEVKASIKTCRDACDALKQAIDYSQCKVMATGERIAWSAIYPFTPDYDHHEAEMMWGALKLAALGWKTVALITAMDLARWKSRRDGVSESHWKQDRLLLAYTPADRIWCTEYGFNGNARSMLSGKRQVGGSRK